MTTTAETKLMAACQKAGIECVQKGNGHWHIKGKLLVNYYPNSPKRTAYIAGTTQGKQNCTPKEAVRMALEAPTGIAKKAPRKSNYKRIKAHMLRHIKNCHWCGVELTLSTATIEHIIPLSRGGLDHSNNRTLACAECNHGRGSDMPEVANA